jgi:F0F1-type ATP synthase beta subunit
MPENMLALGFSSRSGKVPQEWTGLESLTEEPSCGKEAIVADGPIAVPVGRATLGRIFNVLGEPVDGKGEVTTDMRHSIHRSARAY